MGITVVIPTLNRQVSLLQTIQSVLEGQVLPDQIIIVDQSESEEKRCESRRIISDLLADRTVLEYICLDEPSLTHARNVGLSKAHEDIIIFMDDDVDVGRDTFYNIGFIMKDVSLAMIAGVDDSMLITHTKLGYLMGTKSIRNRAIGHVTYSVFGRFSDHEILKETSTQWTMGFFFVVKKPLLDKWGLKFDERLKSNGYAEDLDFTYRYYNKARKDGLRCILSPQVRVVHNASKEWRISDRKSTFMEVTHRIYLQHKFWSGRHEGMLKWAFVGQYFTKCFIMIIWQITRMPFRFAESIKRISNKGGFIMNYGIRNRE